MKFKTIAAEPADSRYSAFHQLVNVDGSRTPALATYDLLDIEEKRDLLLVNESEGRALTARLSPGEQARLNALKTAVLHHARYRSSALERAKAVVNEIADGLIPAEGTTVAVHRFGAVPALILDDSITTVSTGPARSYRIGIYPDKAVRSGNGYRPAEMNSPAEFIRSLTIRPDRTFARYFEDIGELRFDLERHRNQVEAASNAQSAQAVLSGSIRSKLKAALQLPRKNMSRLRALAANDAISELRDLHFDRLVAAQYAADFTEWLLARYWETLGIDCHSESLKQKLHRRFTDLSARAGRGSINTVLASCPEVRELQTGSLPVFAGGSGEFTRVLNFPATIPWVKQYLQFLGYVEFLHDRGLRCDRPRFFFSAHHQVHLSGMLERHLNDLTRNQRADGVQMLNVVRRPASERFAAQARALIGVADVTIAVIPRSLEGIDDARAKSYTWIGRELEHSLLIGQAPLILAQRGFSREAFNDDIAALDDYLAPEARVPNRNARVADLVDGQSFEEIDPTDDHSIDPRVAVILNPHFDRMALARAVTVVQAAMQRLSPRSQELVARVFRDIRYPLTRSRVGRRICRDPRKAEQAFRSALTHVNNALLSINGRRLGLIQRTDRGVYIDGVREILRAVVPSLSDTEVDQLRKRAMEPYSHLGYLRMHCQSR